MSQGPVWTGGTQCRSSAHCCPSPNPWVPSPLLHPYCWVPPLEDVKPSRLIPVPILQSSVRTPLSFYQTLPSSPLPLSGHPQPSPVSFYLSCSLNKQSPLPFLTDHSSEAPPVNLPAWKLPPLRGNLPRNSAAFGFVFLLRAGFQLLQIAKSSVPTHHWQVPLVHIRTLGQKVLLSPGEL